MPLIRVVNDPKAREKPCLRCGYSLRKLQDVRHCPECGLSVWLSLNSNDGLDSSRPEWSQKLSLACWILAGAQVVGLIAYVASFVPRERFEYAVALIMTLGGGYFLMYNAGLLLLTWPERRHPDKFKAYRVSLRIIAGFTLCMGLLMLIRGISRIRLGMEFEAELDAWYIISALALIADALGTMAFLRRLAQRIPNSTLARICGYLLLAPLLPLLKVFPFFSFYLFEMIAPLLKFVPLIYMPVTIILLARFGVLFHRGSQSAVQTWASETLK